MKAKNLFSSTACALTIAVALSAHAQGNQPAQIPRAANQPSATPALGALGPVANVLTEEQRASLRKNLATQREQMRGIETQLRQARRELLAASLNGNFDERNVRPKAMAVARLEAQAAVLRARAVSQIQPPLTADQIKEIMNSLPARGRVGPRALSGAPNRGARRPALTNPKRDENDLPPKE